MLFIEPEYFPKSSSHAVTVHRFSDLRADSDPKPASLRIISPAIYRKARRIRALSLWIQPAKFIVVFNSIFHTGRTPINTTRAGCPALKNYLFPSRFFKLVREPCSALCTTASQNLTTVLCCHSFSEAMFLGTLTLFRLISSKHYLSTSWINNTQHRHSQIRRSSWQNSRRVSPFPGAVNFSLHLQVKIIHCFQQSCQ